MGQLTLVDLDQRPDLQQAALNLLGAHRTGRHHVVCGLPSRMGQMPVADDLEACMGSVVLLDGQQVAGVLAVCPYSDEQATLWGPINAEAYNLDAVGRLLIAEARQALRDGGFESLRAIADQRNRELRAFLLRQGLTAWKDSHCYERDLVRTPTPPPDVRLGTRNDHPAIGVILSEGFPESQHNQPNLTAREKEGYRHYVVIVDGTISGAAAVQASGKRSWIKLIAVCATTRRNGLGRRLLSGVIAAEAALGQRDIGLEVLADNPAAIATFERAGFHKAWTATILTGPV